MKRALYVLALASLAFQQTEGTAPFCHNECSPKHQQASVTCHCGMPYSPTDPDAPGYDPHGYGDGKARKCKSYCRVNDCHCGQCP